MFDNHLYVQRRTKTRKRALTNLKAFSLKCDPIARSSDEGLKVSEVTDVTSLSRTFTGNGVSFVRSAVSYIFTMPDDDPQAKYWLFGERAIDIPSMQPSS